MPGRVFPIPWTMVSRVSVNHHRAKVTPWFAKPLGHFINCREDDSQTKKSRDKTCLTALSTFSKPYTTYPQTALPSHGWELPCEKYPPGIAWQQYYFARHRPVVFPNVTNPSKQPTWSMRQSRPLKAAACRLSESLPTVLNGSSGRLTAERTESSFLW